MDENASELVCRFDDKETVKLLVLKFECHDWLHALAS